MNIEEIKEVIDNLNGVVKGIYRMDEAGLETEDIETILNYITNLQEELDFIKEDANDILYKLTLKEERINKAIEYIEKEYDENIVICDQYDMPITPQDLYDDLINILKGEE